MSINRFQDHWLTKDFWCLMTWYIRVETVVLLAKKSGGMCTDWRVPVSCPGRCCPSLPQSSGPTTYGDWQHNVATGIVSIRTIIPLCLLLTHLMTHTPEILCSFLTLDVAMLVAIHPEPCMECGGKHMTMEWKKYTPPTPSTMATPNWFGQCAVKRGSKFLLGKVEIARNEWLLPEKQGLVVWVTHHQVLWKQLHKISCSYLQSKRGVVPFQVQLKSQKDKWLLTKKWKLVA